MITAPPGGGVALARALLLATVVTLLFSVTAGQFFEAASYIAFACHPELRRRLGRTLHHPVMAGFLPFAAVIALGAFHGPASWHDSMSALIGWRRLLLLPLALAVFDDAAAKRALLTVLTVTCVVAALVGSSIVDFELPMSREHGVLIGTYATQARSCAGRRRLRRGADAERLCGPSMARQLARPRRRDRAARPYILNLLPGRSGYVDLVLMPVLLVTLLVPGRWLAKAAAGLAVLVCLGAVVFVNPHVRERVALAVAELETIDRATEGSSLAQRVVMWRTTARMARDHPILGVGTGGFLDGYRPYIQRGGWQDFETGDPHSQYLKILAEQGVVGLAALAFFIFRVLTCPAATPYRQLAIAAMIGWCATSLANSHFSTFIEGRLLFFWLGAMLATPTSSKTS